MAGNVFVQKAALRKAFEARRRALSAAEVDEWGSEVQRRLAALFFSGTDSKGAPWAPGLRTVALYAAQSFEVPLGQLFAELRTRGVTTAFPRLSGPRQLTFHAVARLDELRPKGRLQLLEPPEGPPVALSDLDAVVVPGVAFTPGGARLGRGGGFYDTALPAMTHALRIGVAFECCVTDELPEEPYDARVHALITERRTLLLHPSAHAVMH